VGVAERRIREKEARRVSILNAAEEVFFEKGFENATMDEVADRAELSKGLLYVYYSNKDDLAHAVAHRGLSIMIEMFEEAVSSKELGIDQISDIGAAYVHFARTYPDYFGLIAHLEARPSCDETEHMLKCEHCGHRAIELTAQAVAKGVHDGSIREELDPMTTAVSLYAQTRGVILVALGQSNKHKFEIATDELVESSLSLIRSGLSCRT